MNLGLNACVIGKVTLKSWHQHSHKRTTQTNTTQHIKEKKKHTETSSTQTNTQSMHRSSKSTTLHLPHKKEKKGLWFNILQHARLGNTQQSKKKMPVTFHTYKNAR